jgi:signal transduction histidine kinase
MQSEPHAGSITQTHGAIRRRAARMQRRIALICGLIVVATALLVTFVVSNQRELALRHARDETTNYSAAFEEQIRRVLNSVAAASEILKKRIEIEGRAFDLSQWSHYVPDLAASTIQVAIIGADGRLVATSLERNPKPIDLSDREHFRVQRDDANLGLYVGKPVRGRVSKKITIQVTRRLQAADGSFGGVLVFSLYPEFLTALHKKVLLGREGIVTLAGLDGIVRARFTATGEPDSTNIGSSIAGSRAIIDARTATEGAYESASLIDGVRRLFHWQKIDGYPLVVIVGLGKQEVLASTYANAQMIIGLGAGAILLAIVMGLLLRREISHGEAQEIRLSTQEYELRRSHEELIASHVALVEAKKEAERSNTAKSTFLANMSHELRTPLNAIIGFSEIIRDKMFGDDLPRYVEYAGDIHFSAVHFLRIINDILDISKIEAGKLELAETEISLERLLASSFQTVTPQASHGKVELAMDNRVGDVRFRCDETRLRQVLINLLSNAVKFTPPGGTVTAHTGFSPDGELIVWISDTGIGMNEDEIGMALEPFQQVDPSLARRYDGTGLGLPLAVRLTELHGGQLEVISRRELGTSVMLRFPADRIAPSPDELGRILEAHGADRRRAARTASTQEVRIKVGSDYYEVPLLDLSPTGMRIGKQLPLPPKSLIELKIGQASFLAMAVWEENGEMGLKFAPSSGIH